MHKENYLITFYVHFYKRNAVEYFSLCTRLYTAMQSLCEHTVNLLINVKSLFL